MIYNKLIILILFIIPSLSYSEEKSETNNILYINSYSYGMNWAQEIYRGIEDTLNNDRNIKIYYEALDSKNFNTQNHYENFITYIKNKYANTYFSAIFCSDNNAFELLLNSNNTLFKNIPVIFCGVNDLDVRRLENNLYFTGIVETPSIKETVDLILKLHPKIKEIFVINDYLISGRAWQKQLDKILANLDIKVTYSRNLPLNEQLDEISNLSKNTIILLGVYYTDKNNINSSYEDMASVLASVSQVPFYTLAKFNLQKGVLGGKVLAGYNQGVAIADIGLEILSGKRPIDQPILYNEYNKFVFNYNELVRFSIDIDNLPLNSEILYKPFSVYKEYKSLIWSIILSFILLSVLIIILFLTMIKRKQAELILNEFSKATWEGIVIHRNGIVLQLNNRFSDIFGYSKKDLIGENFIEKTIAPLYIEKMRSIIEQNSIDHYEVIAIKKDGSFAPIEIRVKEIEFNNKPVRVAVIRDLTDQKKAEKEYNYLLSLWDTMFENSTESIFIFKKNLYIERVNKSFIQITGYNPQEIIGNSLFFLRTDYQTKDFDLRIVESIKKQQYWSGEILARRKSGELFSILLSISSFTGETSEDNKFIGVFSDISHKKQQQEELKWISENDILTGFSNRTYFLEMLKSELKISSRNDALCGILLLNIDGLKNINSTYGFTTGDELIEEFSHKLKSSLREEDIVSRFGGDEFAILAPRFNEKKHINSLVKKVSKIVNTTVLIENVPHEMSASIGVSIFPFDGLSCDELISKASTALKRTKSNKKGSFSFYNSEIDNSEMLNLELELELKKALTLNEMEVHYQPKVDPSNKKIRGFEALIRWHRRKEDWVPPSIFIPITEDNGQIIDIGYFVIERSCQFIKILQEIGFKEFHISINVSAKQFGDSKFIDNLIRIVEQYKIEPHFIDLEITESITASKIFNTIESLTHLSNYGFSISIDDFGTGYSSLQYLMKLPFDTLKIDKSFVDTILIKDDSCTILNTMISLAHTMDKTIVAEGVETEAQVEYLLKEKCQLIQGYYYYKPMPDTEIIKLIKENYL